MNSIKKNTALFIYESLIDKMNEIAESLEENGEKLSRFDAAHGIATFVCHSFDDNDMNIDIIRQFWNEGMKKKGRFEAESGKENGNENIN